MRVGLTFLVVASTACTGGGTGDVQAEDVDASQIIGDWHAEDCSNHASYTIAVNDVTTVWTTYSYDPTDTTCALPYAMMTLAQDYYLQGPANTPDDATKIDLVMQVALLKPFTDATAERWNEQAWCGYTDWYPDQIKNIEGVTCGGVVGPSPGITQYQITKVEDDRWYFGNPASGATTSDETRPTTWMSGEYARPSDSMGSGSGR